MEKLNKDIKEERFEKVYLLYGEEAYLRNQYKNKLARALGDPKDRMNFCIYEGKKIRQGELIDLAETVPFLAARRVIVVENSGFFKTSSEALADYVKNVADTTVLIFVEEEVDKRGKMYKAVKGAGSVTEFMKQNENTLKKWVLGMLSREGKKLSEETLHLFLSKTGNDMENIAMELEKLMCYTLGKEMVTSKDVEEVCTVVITNKIFQMIEAVAEKKQKEALLMYYDLLALKEPPMRILFLIARHFRILMEVKQLAAMGNDKGTIAKNAGLPPFLTGKYMAQAKKFMKEDLRAAVEQCADMEEAVKTGYMNDIMGVELLIVQYSYGKFRERT
ncbi:DNA polymerase III subunit delta [bacterium 1XD42-8]|jgi:DNA polymerase-3 subunit delta|nr:DNA polymerase III subunit delta [Lachnospiraceae bacterium]RKJ38017.1 DNA polymerase III subunit delta [bacterium 1XD42-8]